MPHDKNGNLIEVGNIVQIVAKVVSVQAKDDYCNVDVVTIDPMPPYTEGTAIVLNTKQVIKIAQATAADGAENQEKEK